jgi:type I restriction enzyme R subunit
MILVDRCFTGFDAVVLHTLYLDKDMGGHNLMQSIARVYRVFRDKPGELIVDYVPVTGKLKAALKTYTENNGTGVIAEDLNQAVALMLTKMEVIQQMFHGYEYTAYFTADTGTRMNIIL